MDVKYIVFKRDEFNKWWQQIVATDEDYKVTWPSPVTDAVVIRKQDVFAPPALDAYANSIAVVIQLLNQMEEHADTVAALSSVADYFHSAAAESWQMSRKTPTP